MSRRSAGTVTSRRSPLSVKRRSCVLMRCRRGSGGPAWSSVTAGGRGAELPDRSELVALDLARRGPGELGHEFDPPRVLVRREPVLDEPAELGGKRGARRAVLEDDIGGRLGEGVRVLAPDDGAFEDRVVLEECCLDLERRDPDPADLGRVVAPPVVRVVAVGARRVPVAGEDPLAAKRPLRLRALLPVEGGGRRAAELQVADLAGRDGTVALARHARLVAGDDLAGCARARAAGEVRDGDVAELRRADAVEDLEPEARLPPLEERPRERLAGRDAEAQRREIEWDLALGDREERGVRRGDAVEDGRALPRDRFEDLARLGTARIEDRAGAVAERDDERIVEAVREEELRHAEHAVVGPHRHDVPAVEVGGRGAARL